MRFAAPEYLWLLLGLPGLLLALRRRAERARGLGSSADGTTGRWTSKWTGPTGFPQASRGAVLPLARPRNRLTIRSSREWKVMMAIRPPGARRSIATGSMRSTSPSSSFTAIRRAWNVRVAGWIRNRRAFSPAARSTMPARSRVRSIGRTALRRTIARAIDPASRSSPQLLRIRRSSPSGRSATRSAAAQCEMMRESASCGMSRSET